MTTPNWYQLVLLALASFRIWRLLAEDTVLDTPRRALLRLGKTWEREGDPVPADYRAGWGSFISCAWCLGFWISLAWWGAFQWDEHWTVVVAVPWAISAAAGMIAHVMTE
jgi:hypothetical protein